MRPSAKEQQAVIQLLNAQCERLREIETAHSLLVGGGDYRPRIEYFHDAVRALSSGVSPYEKGTRLSVERLAYDLSFLRHIKAVPLAEIRGGTALSPSTALVPVTEGKGRGEREVRQQISELYKHYAVLFAALFAEPAENNYQSRMEDLNAEVEDLALIEQMAEQLEQGQGSARDMQAMAAPLNDPALRQELTAALNAPPGERKSKLAAVRRKLKEKSGAKDREIAGIEQAHFTYATGQLAVYEDAKEVVKKLALQGMNLAGNFLQGAVAEAARAQRGARGR